MNENERNAAARRSRMARRAQERQTLLDRGMTPEQANETLLETQRRIAGRARAQTGAPEPKKVLPAFSMKMKKVALLKIAEDAGLAHITKANTKAEIYGALRALS